MNDTVTYEEQQLMALYNSGGTRAAMIAELREIRAYLEADDPDVLELIDSSLAKLEAMTDAEYAALELAADYDPEVADGE